MKVYCFDIDGTICSTDGLHDYNKAEPFNDVIKKINEYYYSGDKVIMYTARGGTSGKNWREFTIEQLDKWGVKYHELITSGKPSCDYFIDDKAINAVDFRKSIQRKKIGFIASAFDLLHVGHCMLLKDARGHCDRLVVGLHIDPSIERGTKNKPILSVSERRILLESNRYVDEIYEYDTEKDLEELLERIKPDIRIVGSDYIGKEITGKEYSKEIYYHTRNHNFSSTELRKRIKES
jgi:glycerol-3-phosphate cytidylyltransferase